MVGINGLFHLLINGVFLGVKKPTDPITFDPSTSGTRDILVFLTFSACFRVGNVGRHRQTVEFLREKNHKRMLKFNLIHTQKK